MLLWDINFLFIIEVKRSLFARKESEFTDRDIRI